MPAAELEKLLEQLETAVIGVRRLVIQRRVDEARAQAAAAAMECGICQARGSKGGREEEALDGGGEAVHFAPTAAASLAWGSAVWRERGVV